MYIEGIERGVIKDRLCHHRTAEKKKRRKRHIFLVRALSPLCGFHTSLVMSVNVSSMKQTVTWIHSTGSTPVFPVDQQKERAVASSWWDVTGRFFISFCFFLFLFLFFLNILCACAIYVYPGNEVRAKACRCIPIILNARSVGKEQVGESYAPEPESFMRRWRNDFAPFTKKFQLTLRLCAGFTLKFKSRTGLLKDWPTPLTKFPSPEVTK